MAPIQRKSDESEQSSSERPRLDDNAIVRGVFEADLASITGGHNCGCRYHMLEVGCTLELKPFQG